MSNSQSNFDDILRIARPELRPVCVALRDLVASLHPGCVEVAWPRLRIVSFGVGPKKQSQHYAYLAVQSAHINLGFYHGTSLADPDKLLEGTGKALRHLKLRELADTRRKEVARLVQQAISERRPYA